MRLKVALQDDYMKRKIIIIITLIIGLSFLLYPLVSNELNRINGSKAIQNFAQEQEEMPDEEIEKERQAAIEYNDSLTGANIKDPFVAGSGMAVPDNYSEILNFANNMMGYIEIPKINVKLPIYHGVSEKTLAKGVGHISETAFPIGGLGNHSVLTGHTGLPSAKLFTDLTELKVGDLFYINILNETHAYKIEQILVVDPSNTDDLRPIQGKDYITLVTCTPYGINSHRLLVRGERTEYIESEKENIEAINPLTVSSNNTGLYIILAGAIIIIVVIVILTKIIVRRRRYEK